ncbi:MAG: prepilin-type N-terminal cleavage/methylation domain-containing protein, partial [candidate division Zixibacteria bacterium]|nr:prepilin-type N-terminal cleavage/methylation domain-containing protein [candidate division Zixibacteria bacterium]
MDRSRTSHHRTLGSRAGFTLIEVVIVILIIGILAATAMRSGTEMYETARVEQTRQELDALALAVVGNPQLENNGVRADFGYVGDVGGLPPNLDALYSNPGAYATWRGPYIGNRFTQTPNDYKLDAWGTAYAYSGLAIASGGSGAAIERRFANTTDELLFNTVHGNVYDYDGTPPGTIYRDSVTIRLTHPDGAGGIRLRTAAPDPGGFFEIDSIPIGNHDLTIVYEPSADTVVRFVSVTPRSRPYAEYRLPGNVWTGTIPSP